MKQEIEALLDVLACRPGAGPEYMQGARYALGSTKRVLPAGASGEFRRGWTEGQEIRPYGFDAGRSDPVFQTIDGPAWERAISNARRLRLIKRAQMRSQVASLMAEQRETMGEARWNEIQQCAGVRPSAAQNEQWVIRGF